MKENDLQKLAKFAFWFGCVLFVFIIFFGKKIFTNNWPLFIIGICFFLGVPKFYFNMKDKEAETGFPPYNSCTCSSRRAVWALITAGILSITASLYNM